ncbi:glycosyltransferase [Marinobacterium sp. xm-d-579]|uniref:glycosyltransferase n=1 Tax=Marinobacterium sp. xm-d-579 TaxID=2497734 RepID=UPI001568ABAE
MKFCSLFSRSVQIDERYVDEKLIKIYDSVGSIVIFVTRATNYLKSFKSAKTIYWSHNFYLPPNKSEIHAFDKIVGVSTFHQLWLTLKFRRPCYRVYNTYNIEKPTNILRDYNKLSVAFVGSLNKSKGFHDFIDIVNEVAKCVDSVTVKIFGDGNSAHLIKPLTKNSSVIVEYYGRRDKKFIHKQLSTTIFLLYGLSESGPSETFGLSFLDAQMCGCLPITINRGACIEIVDASLHAYSLKHNQSQIIDLLCNYKPENAEEYSTALVDGYTASSKFSDSNFKKTWGDVLDSRNWPNYDLSLAMRYFVREFRKFTIKKLNR